jgi:hypothetical protein
VLDGGGLGNIVKMISKGSYTKGLSLTENGVSTVQLVSVGHVVTDMSYVFRMGDV